LQQIVACWDILFSILWFIVQHKYTVEQNGVKGTENCNTHIHHCTQILGILYEQFRE
jgi:hypothetical protein